MPDPITKDSTSESLGAKKSDASALTAPEGAGKDAPKDAAKKSEADVPIAFRALIGATGVALLVGFFFPWVRRELEGDEGSVILSGLSLLQQPDLAGTPSIMVIVVPVLGTALAAIAFTGFRYTAYVSIGVSILLFGYAAYVFFQLFVQHTGLGLWISTGAAFLALLLGAGTLLWMRRAADQAKSAKKDRKDDDAASSAAKT